MNTEERLAQINEVSQRILNMPEAERQAYIEQYWDAINEMLNEYKELKRPRQSMTPDPITERTPEQQAALSWDQPTQEKPKQRRRRKSNEEQTVTEDWWYDIEEWWTIFHNDGKWNEYAVWGRRRPEWWEAPADRPWEVPEPDWLAEESANADKKYKTEDPKRSNDNNSNWTTSIGLPWMIWLWALWAWPAIAYSIIHGELWSKSAADAAKQRAKNVFVRWAWTEAWGNMTKAFRDTATRDYMNWFDRKTPDMTTQKKVVKTEVPINKTPSNVEPNQKQLEQFWRHAGNNENKPFLESIDRFNDWVKKAAESVGKKWAKNVAEKWVWTAIKKWVEKAIPSFLKKIIL